MFDTHVGDKNKLPNFILLTPYFEKFLGQNAKLVVVWLIT